MKRNSGNNHKRKMVLLSIIGIIGIISILIIVYINFTVYINNNKIESGKIAKVVNVGDYINYDAGIWTEEQINNLKEKGLYSGEEFPTEENKFHFGGYKIGDSRNNSISSEKNNGWKVLNKNVDGSIDIIQAGFSEQYYNSSKNNSDTDNSKYILSSGKIGESQLYSPRDWTIYENEYAVEGSAHCMTYEEARKIEETKNNKYFDLNGVLDDYWLASSTGGIKDELYLSNSGKTEYLWGCIRGESAGVRIILTIKPNIEVERNKNTQNNITTWNLKENTTIEVGDFINYDAGIWTEEEINDLKTKKLYSNNSEKNTFSGFDVGSSRNNEYNGGNYITHYKYKSGWRVLKKDYSGEITIISATAPEDFHQSQGSISEYILSSGKRMEKYKYDYNSRSWDMYENEYAVEGSAHCITYGEAFDITGNKGSTSNSLRNINGWYLLSSSVENAKNLYVTNYKGEIISNTTTAGVRIIITLKQDVQFEKTKDIIEKNFIWNIKK